MRLIFIMLALLSVVACSSSGSGGAGDVAAERNNSFDPVTRHSVDTSCDLAEANSPKWAECEFVNWQLSLQGNLEQLNPTFQQRSQTQQQENRMAQLQRFADDPSWNIPPTQGNTVATPLCSAGMGPCVGDPFRYPGVDGADGKTFYEQEAEVVPVVYYDQGCARISGHVWRPKHLAEGQKAPMIVIKNGSVQANEELYWWAAQPLVRAGYVVLTSDPRGQGDSDATTPNFGEQGSNFNGHVFYQGLVNDIDFILSSPSQPYPHEQSCAGTYPTVTAAHNPLHEYVDRERLGIAGHSYGAGGVTWVQSYGADGAEPWPGLLTTENPVDVAVAWDALGYSNNGNNATLTSLQLPFSAEDLPGGVAGGDDFPAVVAHKPALSFKSEYGFTPVPFLTDPDRELHKLPFLQWQQADVPIMSLTIAGSTHLDYSLGPDLPATSWCPAIEDNACVGGWARPMITEYTVAWFDRWLKQADEQGYDEADARLLNDAAWADRMSMHFASARDFSTRSGQQVVCNDIRVECGE
jgi:hypothetical protein